MRLIALALASALLARCAQKHQEITPLYVSEIHYQPFTCDQLRDALLHVNTALGNAAYQQGVARGYDGLGLLAVGLPVASMTGRDSTSQVATLKGHQEAINRAGTKKQCGSLAPVINWDNPRTPSHGPAS